MPVDRFLLLPVVLLFGSLLPLAGAGTTPSTPSSPQHVVAIERSQLTLHSPPSLPPLCEPRHDHGTRNCGTDSATKSIFLDALEELRGALHVTQSTWFEIWVGNWPAAIDWTRAVINTHLIATVGTLSKALDHAGSHTPCLDQRAVENEINHYFSQNVAYYFGENAFRIRNEAYDDMLWVVLGWLESVKFAKQHSRLHYGDLDDLALSWHGTQFIEAFAHRARIFYDLASRGWDTDYCDGGMIWNPTLAPYKNAITNELYISASASMYLYFPGDNNTSPLAASGATLLDSNTTKPHDLTHLQNAISGYDWLKSSGMTNLKGLYVDGFHISKNGTKCDIRDNMVYTYNQGVLLSGLRGLWEGTGNTTYLTDGHQLVRDVIRATGWEIDLDRPNGDSKWAGLGRKGIMEDHCDSVGRCSQDSQTFKGVVFHHLALFCEPLPLRPLVPGKTYGAEKVLAHMHRQSCKGYAPWVTHNARAALSSRDKDGRFGMWWGADDAVEAAPLPEGAIDYRNDASQLFSPQWAPANGFTWSDAVQRHYSLQSLGGSADELRYSFNTPASKQQKYDEVLIESDLNDRGRGRTVESQSGGVAVLRCLAELLSIP